MQLTAETIAHLIGGIVEGDPHVIVTGPSRIEEGGQGTITFLGNPKYEGYCYTTTASVIIVSKEFVPKQSIQATLIRVEDVYASIAVLLEKFTPSQEEAFTISEYAVIDPTARLAEEVYVGAFTVVSANVGIGEKSRIFPQVFIGKDVEIGANTILYPGVKVMHRCRIGEGCIIHSNAVIGSDGFGFAPQPDGSYKKIPQAGNVVIEDNVEIGANVTIDRASMGSTVIRSGAKLDNLIQVAHNVEIGENSVFAAQVGIAGSTKVGRNCQIGGQVGFAGHLKIADGTLIQAQSGIGSSIDEPGQKLFGSPAFDYAAFVKSHIIFKKLPELYRQIERMERRIRELEHRNDNF